MGIFKSIEISDIDIIKEIVKNLWIVIQQRTLLLMITYFKKINTYFRDKIRKLYHTNRKIRKIWIAILVHSIKQSKSNSVYYTMIHITLKMLQNLDHVLVFYFLKKYWCWELFQTQRCKIKQYQAIFLSEFNLRRFSLKNFLSFKLAPIKYYPTSLRFMD
jgi:hypothetical protein